NQLRSLPVPVYRYLTHHELGNVQLTLRPTSRRGCQRNIVGATVGAVTIPHRSCSITTGRNNQIWAVRVYVRAQNAKSDRLLYWRNHVTSYYPAIPATGH